jgi:hypothetical protein
LLPLFDLAAMLAVIGWCALAPRRIALRLWRPRITTARAVLLCGLTGFVGCALVHLLLGWPQPAGHDEFGYLLQADTFARGRLTNPPHPFWPHFENFHVLQLPTYTAKYHPAQGLVLALGRALAGHPAVGLWLACGLMGSALAWMLAAWAPARWVVAAGLVATLRWGVGSYWASSYWGGPIAAAGGALVFGALGRLRRGPRLGPALALAVGLTLLALSRPFEGALVALPVAVSLAALAWRDRRRFGTWLRQVALPVALALAALAAWAAYYNWRTTGDPAEHPYMVYHRLYDPVPLFLWLPEKPLPRYRHAVMATEADRFLRHYRDLKSPRYYLNKIRESAHWLWYFFAGPLLSLPLLALPWALRDPWTRLALVAILLTALGLLTLSFWRPPHYAAPLAAPALLVGVRCVRQVRLFAPGGRAIGRRLTAVLLPATLAGIPFQVASLASGRRSWASERVAVERRLLAEPRDDLVLVRFGPWAPDNGWISNGADRERASIVWARQMGPAADCALVAHYAGREVWDLAVGDGLSAPVIERYTACEGTTAAD